MRGFCRPSRYGNQILLLLQEVGGAGGIYLYCFIVVHCARDGLTVIKNRLFYQVTVVIVFIHSAVAASVVGSEVIGGCVTSAAGSEGAQPQSSKPVSNTNAIDRFMTTRPFLILCTPPQAQRGAALIIWI